VSTEAQLLKQYRLPVDEEDAFTALFWHGEHSLEDVEKNLFEWELKDVLAPTIICVESTSQDQHSILTNYPLSCNFRFHSALTTSLNAMSLAMYAVPQPKVMRALYTNDRMDVRDMYSMAHCVGQLGDISAARLVHNGNLTLDFAIALLKSCLVPYSVTRGLSMRPGRIYIAQLRKAAETCFVLLVLVKFDGLPFYLVVDSNRRDKQEILTPAEFSRFLPRVSMSRVVTVFANGTPTSIVDDLTAALNERDEAKAKNDECNALIAAANNDRDTAIRARDQERREHADFKRVLLRAAAADNAALRTQLQVLKNQNEALRNQMTATIAQNTLKRKADAIAGKVEENGLSN
jgi:hypothetical protein